MNKYLKGCFILILIFGFAEGYYRIRRDNSGTRNQKSQIDDIKTQFGIRKAIIHDLKTLQTVKDAALLAQQKIKDAMQFEIEKYKDHFYLKKGYYTYEKKFWGQTPFWQYGRLKRNGTEDPRILDIGCFVGTYLTVMKTLFPKAELYCIDLFDIHLTKGMTGRLKITKHVGDIQEIEIPFKKKFDVIILTEVIEHLHYNPVDTLIKLRKALKPSGRIYITTPDADSDWGITHEFYKKFSDIPFVNTRKVKKVDSHIWQYRFEELVAVILKAGLVPTRMDYSWTGANKRHFNFELGIKNTKPKIVYKSVF